MSESLVGFGHLVGILSLLHRFPFVVRSRDDLFGELFMHRLAFLRSGGVDDPLHGELLASLRADFSRDLVVRASDSSASDFHSRAGILERKLEEFQRILYLGRFFDLVEGSVDDRSGGGFLAFEHHIVDELGDLF
ncbi:MAG: protein containing repeat [Parcubacteria group bacterium]|nr:protein containing repeat [Parcubacteria group bacterium]